MVIENLIGYGRTSWFVPADQVLSEGNGIKVKRQVRLHTDILVQIIILMEVLVQGSKKEFQLMDAVM